MHILTRRTIREWYSYHFPELIKVVPDNYLFAKCAQFIKNRKELSEESLPQLTEIVNDAGIAQSVLDASRSSMGKMKNKGLYTRWNFF